METYNFVDGDTLYSFSQDISDIMRDLRHYIEIFLKWFKIISLKVYPKKFQILISAKRKQNKNTFTISSNVIHEYNSVVLLRIAIDNNLKFREHIENLYRLANFKLHGNFSTFYVE